MVIKIKHLVSYNGHSLKANGSVDFNLKSAYSELVNTIKLTQLLNNDITIKAKVNKQTINLGVFKIKSITIDGDGESKIKLNGLNEYIELDNLNSLPLQSDDVQEFYVLYQSDVEIEGDKEE